MQTSKELTNAELVQPRLKRAVTRATASAAILPCNPGAGMRGYSIIYLTHRHLYLLITHKSLFPAFTTENNGG